LDDLPKDCFPRLSVAIAKAVDNSCPSLLVTAQGRQLVANVKRVANNPMCDARAREHVNQYRREMPTAWCLAMMSIVNVGGYVMLEFRR
jgi:hypothetical protein